MTLIQLFVVVLVLGLVYWLVMLLPVPQPFKAILQAVAILIMIVWLLSVVGMLPRSCGHVVQLDGDSVPLVQLSGEGGSSAAA